MLKIVIIFFVLASTIYAFIVAPRIAARIASARSLDSRKWFMNTAVFNIFALIYLSTLLDSEQHSEKRTLLVLISIYIVIFAGVYVIDTYTVF